MAMHYTEFCHLTVAMIVQKLNEKRSESHWHSRRMRLDILELAEAVIRLAMIRIMLRRLTRSNLCR